MILPRQKPLHPVDPLEGPRPLSVEFWGGNAPADLIRQRALDWMMAIDLPINTVDSALEAIAWAQGLPLLSRILDPVDYRAIWELLCSAATAAEQMDLRTRPLLHQLLTAELAFTLAVRLPDDKPRRLMQKLGRAAAALGLGQIPDTQGMPATEHFSLMLPLLACWTRCGELAKDSTGVAFGLRALRQFDRFVRNVMRIIRPDGGPPFSAGDTSLAIGKVVQASLRTSCDATTRQIASVALTPKSGKVSPKPKKGTVVPPASLHCEASQLAVLRHGWNRDDERLIVRFVGQSCEIELVTSGRLAVSGTWQLNVSRQGRPLEPVSDWHSICWHSDADVDYLELQIELTDGVIVQRHLVLAREDRFLLLADSVLGTQLGGLEYCGVMPLTVGIEFQSDEETREGLLVKARNKQQGTRSKVNAASDPIAKILPLALPEWKSDARIGQLTVTARGLELHQETEGRRVFAPLFVDLDRARFHRRLTWRTLTVAESLLPVPTDRAVGYRVAVGREQWLVYRSLGPVRNRTLLGHNLSTETLIAKFGTDGEVTPIIEIE
jgi:hypothetical protein